MADDLVERVAQAVYAHPIDGLDRDAAHQIAVAVIDLVLEEAARIVKARSDQVGDIGADGYETAVFHLDECEEAIRALKTSSGASGS